ncbi:hypothetical protein Pfo_024345 [Paulownia fortunei]|nr:hypothetical protein Pfo_024345 [Paulownia fortunei]
MPRRRPLHTCGASCLAIAHKACTKMQDFDGPLGSMAKRAITFINSFFPFVYSMLHQWLALLSFMDDHILSVECMIEMVFPPSTHLFDKIDGLVCSAEVLPEQLDDVFRKFPLMMHQFPFLDWVLVHLISLLNCLLSILTHWGSKNAREKEITIDVNCNDIPICKSESEEKAACCPVISLAIEQSDSLEDKAGAARNHKEPSNSVHFEELEKSYSSHKKANAARNHIEPSNDVNSEVIQKSVERLRSLKNRIKALEEPHCAADSPMYSSYQSANSSPVSDCSQDETNPFSQIGKSDTKNCTYKEMLKRGKKEDGERKEDKALLEFPKAIVNEEKAEIAETDGKYGKEGTIESKS